MKKKMSEKRAKELYKKAHRGLTPQEEKDAHKAEKLLKKKKIEAERKNGKFEFKKKKKKNKKHSIAEARVIKKIRDAISKRLFATEPGSGELSPTGDVLHEPVRVPPHLVLKKRIKDMMSRKKTPNQINTNDEGPF